MDSVQYSKITNALEPSIVKLHQLNAHLALRDIHLTKVSASIVQEIVKMLDQMGSALLVMKDLN